MMYGSAFAPNLRIAECVMLSSLNTEENLIIIEASVSFMSKEK